jgi:hypothetical protein
MWSHHFTEELPEPIITTQELTKGDEILLEAWNDLNATITIQQIQDDYVTIEFVGNWIAPLVYEDGKRVYEIAHGEKFLFETLTESTIIYWEFYFMQN